MNRPILQGGTRRRPGHRRRRTLATLLAVVALAGGALYALNGQGDGTRPVVASAGGPSVRDRAANESPVRPQTVVPPGLSLTGPNAFSVRLAPGKPRAALVVDMKTGRVLYKRHPVERLPVASLTKIMTALIVVDETRRRDKARVSRTALAYSGSGVGVLPRGKKVPVDGLLAGLLLPSGNDAAIALAEHVSGSERRFVKAMNRRARRLGLRCTRFVSSHGLEPGNRSCAADLAVLSRLAMKEPRITRLVGRRQVATPFPIDGGHLFVNSTNPLLRLRYRGTTGLKTGYNRQAGRCFVGVARRGRRQIGVVLLHSPDTGRHAKQLLNAAFRAGRT